MNPRFKLIFLILLFVPLIASAEWYKDYEEAMELIKKNQYGQAIPRLQSALRQKNAEGANIKFYGMKFGDYFPHYYLGRAYFYQNDYQSAMAEFSASESQGEIQKKRDLYKSLTDFKSIANAQIAMATEKKPAPQPEVVTPKPEPPKVAENKPKETPPQEIKKDPPLPSIEEKPVKVADLPKKDEKIKPEPTVQPPVAVPEETPREKSRKIAKEGARKYFAGDYDGAISSFSQALKVDGTDSSAHFLLGCSFAAKYLLSGSQDRRLFDSALAEFQRAKRANVSGPILRSPYISPVILEMYEKSGA